ncbi:flagellin lysine-N-methylase [Oscillibacter sp. 1-3]|uniref:flagellin lysine-N-methylase n=1 Tax=Oscillibacter sp. 1-3 TaxID=1235797 RepID=UPI0003372AF1|nr:flagellin lysine-N-methylase [Oscillibacter sp. 1-3]EOS66255.1 hypothetical protein C816_01301 [Oscillibacter sp. 1-3]
MPETPYQVLIDKDLRPAYYDDFRCLSSACRLNCCGDGWHIGFDKKDYQTIKRQKGTPELNARLEHCVRRVRSGEFAGRNYGEFVLHDGVCPLLRDGICSLQREKGEEALPKICRAFPRSESCSPSGYFERMLGLGCEGVLSLLWNLPGGVNFVSDPLPKARRRMWEPPKDQPLPPYFQEIRSVCIDILQDRRLALPERIFVMGMALRELADGEEDIPRWLARAAVLADQIEPGQFLRHDSSTLSIFLMNNANNLHLLIQGGRPSLLGLAKSLELERNPESGHFRLRRSHYLSAQARFNETLGKQEWFWENLMVTLFYNWRLPDCTSRELLWRSYVNFCNMYSIYRFLSVMSCRDGVSETKEELFRLLVIVSRALIHSTGARFLSDQMLQHDSATLAHMAILLSG